MLHLSEYITGILLYCHLVVSYEAIEKTEMRNKLVLDNIFSTSTSTTSVIDCFWKCVKFESCWSIAYQKETTTCHLYSSLNENNAWLVNAGWKTYLRTGYFCPISSGYIYNYDVNLCYKMCFVKVSFEKAEEGCTNDGSILIRIDSGAKQAEIGSQLLAATERVDRMFYIQGKRQGTTTKWAFDDSTPMTYYSWNTQYYYPQPDNIPGKDRIVMNADDGGKWHDSTTTDAFSYICENKAP